MKVGGQVGVVGDDQRQAQRAALFSASIVESGDTEQRWVRNVNQIRLELAERVPEGRPWRRQPQFGIHGERPALHADDGDTFKFTHAAIGRNHQHLVAEIPQLADAFAERGDDAVNFWNESLCEERDAHGVLLYSTEFQQSVTRTKPLCAGKGHGFKK